MELTQDGGLQAVVGGVSIGAIPTVGNGIGEGLAGGACGATGGEGGSGAGLADVGVAADVGAVALRADVVEGEDGGVGELLLDAEVPLFGVGVLDVGIDEVVDVAGVERGGRGNAA